MRYAIAFAARLADMGEPTERAIRRAGALYDIEAEALRTAWIRGLIERAMEKNLSGLSAGDRSPTFAHSKFPGQFR